MRRIFSLFLLMAFTINICAIDELQIKPHQTIAGLSDESDDAYIELYLVNESFDIANLQFDILLPEGMEYADYGEFTDRVPSTTKKGNKTYDFSYQTNALEDGYTRFMFIPGGEMRKIEKGSGTILYINFKTNANMAAGIHPILMKNIKLVESTTSAITIDDVSSYVIIGDNNPLKTETDINMSSLIGSIPSFVVQAINADIASNAGLKYIDLTGADALGADFVMPNDQAKIVVKEGSPLANLSYAVTSKEPAVEGIAINETNFPDANFRSYLLSEDYGSDGVITDAEIAEITYIGVDEKNIANLKGIEFFTALTYLSCSNNQLTALDLSKNSALIYLYCSNNQLTSLDVSKNTALQELYSSNNQLAALDISKNTALTILSCDNNQLTSLDVSKNTALQTLYCNYNQLTVLDVSKNTALQTLYCDYNQLTSLDVSKNTALKHLYCNNNQLTMLNVSGCTALKHLFCFQNQIRGTAMDALIASLSINEETTFYAIYYQDEGNVMTAAQVAAARAKGWRPMAFNETYNTWLSYLGEGVPEPAPVDINETNFPDETFRNYVSSNFDLSQNGKLEYMEFLSIKNINVNDMNIQSMKGIEYFPELEKLKCKKNQLTSIDISKNTLLMSLDITRNQLTTLDLSKNPIMENLYVAGNHLTTLDVSKHSLLRQLECENNQLTTLDLSNKPNLESLYCDNNKLTALDFSETPVIRSLRFYNNKIKGTAMDKLVNSLPQYQDKWGGTEGTFRALTTKATEGNTMTTTQVAVAKAKSWTPYYGIYQETYEGEDYYSAWEEYAGSDPTAIEGIESDTSASKNGSDVYFDLSGRRVTAPTKGVYVKNGKKVVVK